MTIEVELPDGSIVEFPDDTSSATMEMALAKYRERPAKPAKPSFSNVASGGGDFVQDTAATQAAIRANGAYGGPLLRQNAPHMAVPTLESANANNRSYMVSDQKRIDDAAYRQDQQSVKKRKFAELPAPARALIGLGSEVDRARRGFGQLYATAADYIDPREQTVAGLISGQQPTRLQEAQRAEAEARAGDAYLEGDTAADIGQIGGQLAMAAIPLSRVGNLGRAGNYAASAATGAGMGLLQPTVEGESRGVNTGLGAGLGLLGQAGSDVLMATGKRAAQAVTPELRNLYEVAKQRGIQLAPADLSNSEMFKRVAGYFGRQPLAGGQARQGANRRAFNREAAKTFTNASDEVDQGVMANAYDDFNLTYDRLTQAGGTYDRQFLRDVAQIKREAAETMDDAAQRTINTLSQRVKKQASGGQLQGRTLQSLDRQAREATTGGGDRQMVAQKFRTALQEAQERTNPLAAEWRDVNRRYSNFKRLEPLVARNPQGGIEPGQLLGAVTKTGRDKARFARGQMGDLGELATIASRMRKPATSGTPEGLQAAEYGNPLLWPLIAARAGFGASAGRGLNSGLLADYFASAGRGQMRQELAPLMRPASFGLMPYADFFQDPSESP